MRLIYCILVLAWLMLECSRMWLLKIVEIGESYFHFDGVKKRSLFFCGKNNKWNGTTSVSLILSVDGDCTLYLNGRALQGRVVKTCFLNPRSNGFQYILKVDGHVYKFSVLEDYKTAIFEEIIGSP